jgi:hypothetical protein
MIKDILEAVLDLLFAGRLADKWRQVEMETVSKMLNRLGRIEAMPNLDPLNNIATVLAATKTPVRLHPGVDVERCLMRLAMQRAKDKIIILA